jgi:class I lanthipeptide synthase
MTPIPSDRQPLDEFAANASDALCATLVSAAYERFPPEGSYGTALMHGSLATGLPGIALALMFLGEANGKDFSEPIDAALRETTNIASRFPLPLSLFNGVAGIGWVLEHYRRRRDEPEMSQSLDSFDDVIWNHLRVYRPWTLEVDLINGLVGFGVYALERLPRPRAVAIVQLVFEHLREVGQLCGETVAYLTPSALLPGPIRHQEPEGLYDFGLAHGQAGVLAFLASVYEAGICKEEVGALMVPLAAWLIAHARIDTLSIFPRAIRPNGGMLDSSFAWCRGDPGIALALLRAARSCNRDDWEETAMVWLHRSTARSLEDSPVFGACVCHGSIGLSLIFRQAHKMTGDPLLESAASYWLEATRQFGCYDTPTGFRFSSKLMPESDLGPRGFLMGAAGTALALAVDRCDRKDWQRLLLLDHDREA